MLKHCHEIECVIKLPKLLNHSKKGSTWTGKRLRSNNVAVWLFLCQNWFFQTWIFPILFYLFSFTSEFCYIFIENWQSYKERLFFADIETFSIVSNIFEHILNQFAKHMEALIIAETQVSWQRKKQSLAVLSKKGSFKISWYISQNTAQKLNLLWFMWLLWSGVLCICGIIENNIVNKFIK